MSHSAEDAAIFMNVIAGHDPKDSTSIQHDVPDYTKTLQNVIKGLTIGLPEEYFTGGLEPGVNAAIQFSAKASTVSKCCTKSLQP